MDGIDTSTQSATQTAPPIKGGLADAGSLGGSPGCLEEDGDALDEDALFASIEDIEDEESGEEESDDANDADEDADGDADTASDTGSGDEAEETAQPAPGDDTAGEKAGVAEASAQPPPTGGTASDAAYRALSAQVMRTLSALGIRTEGSDALAALEQAAAEADGMSVEDYRRAAREKSELEEAKRALRVQRFEELAARDLAALRLSYPETLGKAHIKDCFDTFADFERFGRLRDAGVEAPDAYMAVNGRRVLETQRRAAVAASTADNKAHIRPAAGRPAQGETVEMPHAELAEWRELFPGMPDREIRRLWKQTN